MIASALTRLGSDEHQGRYLLQLAAGNVIAGFALSKTGAGSDAAAIVSSARRDGDSYLLRGRKQWCTNGSFAGVTLAMFRTGGPGPKGISAFLVDNDRPGIVVEK